MAMRLLAVLVVVSGLVFPGVADAQDAASLTPTFTRDVAPLFFAHCTTCHRPGEIAPMSLLTYKDARSWPLHCHQVRSGAMPPWHADPAIGTSPTSDAERRTEATVARWGGCGRA
jgi:hypothetical protein